MAAWGRRHGGRRREGSCPQGRPPPHPPPATLPILLPRNVKAVNEADDRGRWGPGPACVSVTYFLSFPEGWLHCLGAWPWGLFARLPVGSRRGPGRQCPSRTWTSTPVPLRFPRLRASLSHERLGKPRLLLPHRTAPLVSASRKMSNPFSHLLGGVGAQPVRRDGKRRRLQSLAVAVAHSATSNVLPRPFPDCVRNCSFVIPFPKPPEYKKLSQPSFPLNPAHTSLTEQCDLNCETTSGLRVSRRGQYRCLVTG